MVTFRKYSRNLEQLQYSHNTVGKYTLKAPKITTPNLKKE